MAELLLKDGVPPVGGIIPDKLDLLENPDSPEGEAEGDEYSSGSDRSYEDGEAGNGESGTDGTPSKSDKISCARRRRRHGSHGSRRHKGGSRHKKFHPYLPQDEEEVTLKRKSLDRKAKENAAAVIRREEGRHEYIRFPVAPFNSTQYLMEEHKMTSPASAGGLPKAPSNSKVCPDSPAAPVLVSVNSTPMDCSSPNPETVINLEKKDKEFVDIYTSVHAESLQSLPKDELVKHYMSLEEKVATLEKQILVKQRKLEDQDVKLDGDVDKDVNCDSVSGSDTNSLSSSNEDFVDLSAINQPTISVGESDQRTSTSYRAMQATRSL